MSKTDPGPVEALYPFLYADSSDLDAVLAEVRRSTEEKAREIITLRATVLAEQADRLARCAEDMAERFANRGRLLVFGNGGSSTDAQDMATCFLSPAGDKRPLPAFGLTNDIAVVTALSNDIGFDVV